MRFLQRIFQTPNRRIAAIALAVIALDQLTKHLVLRYLGFWEEKVVIDGFFKFVYWWNTGAAWSLFSGNNLLLAVIAVIALVVLLLSRHHFNGRTPLGQLAFGLIFGGIVGNLIDRLTVHHVIDFLYFHLGSWYWPAFNLADSAICIGVVVMLFEGLLGRRHGLQAKEEGDRLP